MGPGAGPRPPQPQPPVVPTPKPAGPPKPLALHALFLPDQGRTWVVIAADDATLSAHANILLSQSPAPDSARLRGRIGMEPLRDGKSGAGGFFTLRALPSGGHQLGALFAGAFSGVGPANAQMKPLPDSAPP